MMHPTRPTGGGSTARGVRRIAATALAALAATSLAIMTADVVSAAPAGSIVYLKNGYVWIANSDGTHARQFTTSKRNWVSPSEADDGTVVVAGGLTGSGGSELYRFHPNGIQIGKPIPTWGTYSTPACTTYGPRTVRVSPDASKIAYGIWDCASGSYTALWTPATATGLSFPHQTLGQEDFYEPQWVSNSQFLVTHAGPTITDTQARWFTHDVTQADDTGIKGWNEPTMTGTGAQAVISRNGGEFAVFEDDAADWLDAKPRTVRLWIYTGSNIPDSWTKRCVINLNAAQTTHPLQLSPSISPDGTEVVWGDDKGVEVAPLTNLGNCSSVTPHLLIPGGAQPFFSKGTQQPAATGPIARFTWSPAKPHARHAVAFNAGKSTDQLGTLNRWTWNFGDRHTAGGKTAKHTYAKAGHYTVTLTIYDRNGRKAAVKHRITIYK